MRVPLKGGVLVGKLYRGTGGGGGARGKVLALADMSVGFEPKFEPKWNRLKLNPKNPKVTVTKFCSCTWLTKVRKQQQSSAL